MSVEPAAFERSKLEQKDRAELATIVEAMGGKAASRSKKADLVDQILTLAGVPVGRAPAEPDADADPIAEAPAERAGGRDDSPSDPRPADALDARAGRPAGSAGRATGSDDRPEPAAGERTDHGRPDRTDRRPDRADPRPDRAEGNDRTERSERDDHDDVNDRNDRNDRNERNGQGDGGGDARTTAPAPFEADDSQLSGGNRPAQGQDDVEPSNRRRRRRGRDRGGDRERQGGAAPQESDTFVGEPVEVEGYLDLREEGYGFLRLRGYLPTKDDVYVSVKQARQFGLRKGDFVKGASRPASRNEKNPALLRIDLVNDQDPDAARVRPRFEDLTPLFPDEKLRLEHADDPANMTARIVDLICPIGKGQRGLIVSPPKAGKTTIMKQIARSVEINNPEVHLIVLLVDERPEEVTDFRRWLQHGEVAASTFDRPSEEHTVLAELVIERAKRLVEYGRDVVIILDGITRLARAYNLAQPNTGRIMSGGIDAGALYPPKKFFGAARNVEEGGSLTILASALVETNSRMDDHIFEEFKGTGNMELKLDRRLAERRIYPAIDVDASSTRHEELLFNRMQLQQVWKLRRVLSALAGDSGGSGGAGLELLIDRMKTFKSNDEFLTEIAKAKTISP